MFLQWCAALQFHPKYKTLLTELRLICVVFETYVCNNMNSLRWRHNGRGSVSNHQPHHCLLNRLFRRRSKKTSKLRVTGLWAGNSPGTGEFPTQMASNAENVSIWWRHNACYFSALLVKEAPWCFTLPVLLLRCHLLMFRQAAGRVIEVMCYITVPRIILGLIWRLATCKKLWFLIYIYLYMSGCYGTFCIWNHDKIPHGTFGNTWFNIYSSLRGILESCSFISFWCRCIGVKRWPCKIPSSLEAEPCCITRVVLVYRSLGLHIWSIAHRYILCTDFTENLRY